MKAFISWINYVWRLFAKGFSFTCFGIGGFFIGGWLCLLYFLNLYEKEVLHDKSRRIVAKTFGFFVFLMKSLGLISYEIRHAERLDSNRAPLIVANHLTLIDVVFLVYFAKNPNCIVKASLLSNPFTRPPIKACGFIKNDSDTLLGDATASLKKGEKLIIFPEGTRKLPDAPVKFLRGTARMALNAGCDITPVFIHCNPLTLHKNNKWYQLGNKRSHFVFDVKAPISIQPWLDSNEAQTQKARHLTAYLEAYYLNEFKSRNKTQV